MNITIRQPDGIKTLKIENEEDVLDAVQALIAAINAGWQRIANLERSARLAVTHFEREAMLSERDEQVEQIKDYFAQIEQLNEFLSTLRADKKIL